MTCIADIDTPSLLNLKTEFVASPVAGNFFFQTLPHPIAI
jgi:hypothetical protein